jgi:hypothetical protein
VSAFPKFHLYKTATGVASYLNRLSGNLAETGLSFYDVITGKNIILASGTGGQVWRFSDGAWSQVATVGTSESEGIFVSSTGIIFLSPKTSGELYTSVDGGFNYVLSLTLVNSDSNIRTFCETADGWIIGGEYPSDIVAPALHRTRDGTTWENITNNLALTVNRHIHSCFYDTYRNLLFVTHGDSGANSFTQVSSDSGDSFASMTQHGQMTGMAFTREYIYFAGDASGDRSLYRIKESGNPVGSPEVEELILTPRYPIANDNGFVWQFHWSNGILLAPYIRGTSCLLYACDNFNDPDGVSWHLIDETVDNSATENAYSWQAECANQDNFNGIRYMADTDGSKTCQAFQVIRWGQKINLDPINGFDGGDGISQPLKTLGDYLPLQRDTPIILQNDVTENIYLADTKYLIANGLYGFSASAPVAESAFITDFEAGNSTLTEFTSTGATVDQANTTNPQAGTRCMRCDAGTATGTIQAYGFVNNFSSNVVEGDEIYLMGSCSVSQATLPSDLVLMWIGGPNVSGDAAECELFIESTTGELQIKLNETINGLRHYKQGSVTPVVFPTQQYVKLKMRIKASDTKGRVTVWVDDVIALDIIGVQTFVSGSRTLNDARVGFKSTAKPLTVDWDDVNITINKDPEVSSALILSGANQKIHGLKQVSGQIEVGGVDNELIACVADTPTVTPVKLTGVNPACYHGTFKNGSVAIENTSSTGLVKNNVFLDQSTQAISDSGTVDTKGNEYNTGNTFGVTPDATDTERAVNLLPNLHQDYGFDNIGVQLFPNKRDARGLYFYLRNVETGAFAK